LEVIDVTGLLQRCMGDFSLASQLLQMFQSRGPNKVARLAAHLAAGEFGPAAACAHSLKGEAGSVGAQELHEAASRLEKRLKTGVADDIDVQVESLQTALGDLLAALPAALGYLAGEQQTAVSI
jgi:two-component system sensor histidine kinase/response regulator